MFIARSKRVAVEHDKDDEVRGRSGPPHLCFPPAPPRDVCWGGRCFACGGGKRRACRLYAAWRFPAAPSPSRRLAPPRRALSRVPFF